MHYCSGNTKRQRAPLITSYRMSLFDRFLQSGGGGPVGIQSRSLWRDDYNYEGPAQITSHLRHYPNLPAVRKHITIASELSEELNNLTEYDVCTHCQAQYQLIDNLGTHRCCYHPDPGSDAHVFRCCGVSKQQSSFRSRGCVPCDHSPRNYKQKNPHAPRWNRDSVFARVPKAARHLLRFPDSSIVGEETKPHDPIKSFLIVTRVSGYGLQDV